MRVLHRHRKQLGLAIALVKECSELFSLPGRFHALPTNGSASDATRQLPALGEEGLLRCLSALHLSLYRSALTLSESSRGHGRGSALLLEAAQMHDEMGWTLDAMLHEHEAVIAREPRTDRPTEPAGKTEGGAYFPYPESGLTLRKLAS